MSVEAPGRRRAFREALLAVLGLLLGPLVWVIVLYGTAFVVSPLKESNLGLAQAVFVLTEIVAIAGLALAAIRTRPVRFLLLGTLVSFVLVTAMFWRSAW